MGVIISGYAFYRVYSVTTSYEHLLEISIEAREAMQQAQGYVRDYVLITTTLVAYTQTGYSGNIETLSQEADDVHLRAVEAVQYFSSTLYLYPQFTQEDINRHMADANEIISLLGEFRQMVYDPILGAVFALDYPQALSHLDQASSLIERINDLFNKKLREATILVEHETASIRTSTNYIYRVMVGSSTAVFLLSVFLALWISSSISKPIKSLVDAAHSIAKGNFNINIYKSSKDETGMLAESFEEVVGVIHTITDDLQHMATVHFEKGEIDSFLDEQHLPGQFGVVARQINAMVKQYIELLEKSLNVLGNIATVDFNTPMEKLPGKKIFINNIIETTRQTCRKIEVEITELISEATKGNLSVRANADSFVGDWASTMKSMNKLLDVIVLPIEETSRVMKLVESGDLTGRMNGRFKGDFRILQESINNTMDYISSYITEISNVLHGLSQNNLRQDLTLDYVGSFSQLKESFLIFIETINRVIYEVCASTVQVNSGVLHMAVSSTSLADGSTMQSTAAEHLSEGASAVSKIISDNLESVEQAKLLSIETRDSATAGAVGLDAMLKSMASIENAFSDISGIMKTIETIALQTKLLSLNATVEAARAGEHGKSFAVVAEEVRNLAALTRNAADETAAIIANSREKVDDGLNVANQTSLAFDLIVSQTEKLAHAMDAISHGSLEQSDAMSNFNKSIHDISTVVLRNAATSQEVAAMSEQLASQSELMSNMVTTFKIKGTDW
ncbi:MAG: methyl-accepting chemotaxis protein [Firmicutes bacterium]|nr:methyl-accepting chemotaxis protein [Bacillota bacterium]